MTANPLDENEAFPLQEGVEMPFNPSSRGHDLPSPAEA
jgi:hypothetical protein